MVDSSLCPIPPDFKVQGDISDDFEKYKTTTGYGSIFSREHGYSHRWKNTKIRSANIVIGFQFKIGPEVAYRWKIAWDPARRQFLKRKTEDRFSGDVNIILPRAQPLFKDRGVYGLNLEWKISMDPRDHRTKVNAGLFKEIPHGTYSGEYGFDGEFNVENPNPHIINIKDGKWHGMVGVIWNSLEGVTMSLWYNPRDTHNFNDFIFLGKGLDSLARPIPPRSPLTLGLDEVDESPEGGLWGNELFVAEHDLGIRIDEIATEHIEVRNMYAANVAYVRHTVAPPVTTLVPDVRDNTPGEAYQRVMAAGLVPRFLGPNEVNSWIYDQSPEGGRLVYKGSVVFITLKNTLRP